MMDLNIFVVCDAGMGSSALGASLIQKKLKEQNINLRIQNCSIAEVPNDAHILITHRMFYNQLQETYTNAKVITFISFTEKQTYERIVREIMEELKRHMILHKDCIEINCKKVDRKQAIDDIGQTLLEAGFIEAEYIEGMHKRDESLTTFIGNDIAIPHGEYEVKPFVKQTGLAVKIYPEPIDWNGNPVRVVIGIAAKDSDHIEILSNIAMKLGDMREVEELVNSCDIEYIHSTLTKA
ncbi:PTS system D-mannitol-specific IIA component (Fru family) [Breznakia blatticola]|uniref:Mannitol-specific phosphotransferase enzyme IIA component n=1 Tax=Breznakia blatticola TaxID=1754012 RepID=A0A4R7ZUY2_9FIRM|nr:PTS sugar transporter subunit IIA [Breznakia blatticola]TDW20811.1 PTS system D-mannitol-specific IIA component (Fru family) [Breznakia blatticola]